MRLFVCPIGNVQEAVLGSQIYLVLGGSFLCLSVFSPYTAKYFSHILLICVYVLSVFSVQVKILLAYSFVSTKPL